MVTSTPTPGPSSVATTFSTDIQTTPSINPTISNPSAATNTERQGPPFGPPSGWTGGPPPWVLSIITRGGWPGQETAAATSNGTLTSSTATSERQTPSQAGQTTPSITATTNSGAKLSPGAGAGIGIACTIALGIVAALLIFYRRRFHRRRKVEELAANGENKVDPRGQGQLSGIEKVFEADAAHEKSELDQPNAVHELDDGVTKYEASGYERDGREEVYELDSGERRREGGING